MIADVAMVLVSYFIKAFVTRCEIHCYKNSELQCRQHEHLSIMINKNHRIITVDFIDVTRTFIHSRLQEAKITLQSFTGMMMLRKHWDWSVTPTSDTFTVEWAARFYSKVGCSEKHRFYKTGPSWLISQSLKLCYFQSSQCDQYNEHR